MAFLHNSVYDSGLSTLTTGVNRMDLCTTEPTTYAEATSTLTAGNKTAYTVGAATARTPDGRKVVAPAVTDGTVTTSTTVGFWALVQTGTSTLLATGALAAPVAISTSGPWTTPAFDIGIPAAVNE